MKLKHIFILTMFLFVGMLCLSSINAVTLNDNLTTAYLLDENTGTTAGDEIGTNDGTLIGTPTWTTGKINYGLDFDGSSDRVSGISPVINEWRSGTYTISAWVNIDALGSDYMIYSEQDDDNDNTYGYFRIEDTGEVTSGTRYLSSSNQVSITTDNPVITAGSWYHIVLSVDGSLATGQFYINGVNVSTSTFTNQGSGEPIGVDRVDIGAWGRSTIINYLDGKMDEVYIWDRALSSTEVEDLYDRNVLGEQPLFTDGTTPQLTFENITANDETFTDNSYWNTSELDFYVEVLNTSTNGNVDIYYSLWNSTNLITDNEQIADNSLNTDNFKYNFTTFNNPTINIGGTDYNIYGASNVATNALQYCNEQGFIYSSSYTVSASIYFIFATYSSGTPGSGSWQFLNTTPITRPKINSITCYNERNFSLSSLLDNIYNIQFFAENNETNVTSTNYTFIIDTTPPTINNNIPSEINSYILTLNSSCTDTNLDYCNITINNQTTALNSTNITLTENGNLTYTITAEDLAGNIATETGTLLVNPPFYVYFTYPNGTSITNFTINGTSYSNYFTGNIYDYGLGTHTFGFSKNGFVDTDFSLTFNTTSDINTTYNITPSSIYISIYDRDTGNLITDNVTIVLVATYGYNSTTSTGTLNISDIQFRNESYQVIATSDDYVSESVYFDFDNRETKLVNIYMIKSNLSNLGTHTIKAITDTGLLVNGAVCSALEWKPALSSFVTVAQGLTDSNGETIVNVELGTKLYKFKCVKGDSSAESNNKIISSSGDTTTIQLAETIITPDNIFGDLTYSLTNITLNSTHQRIIYSFTDGNNLVDIGCLKIYKVIGTKRTLLQESCVTSSDAEIQLDQNINATYLIKAVASINIDGVVTELAYINFEIENSIENALEEYGLDIILPLIFLLIGVSIGFLVKPQNIYISLIGCSVMVWLSVAIVPSVISATMASFITLLCGIMLWGGYKFK